MARLRTVKTEEDIDDLFLDRENPRTGTVSGQSDALEAVVRLNSQHFRNMMISIKEHDLDPGDSFYIISNENDEEGYTVVDENRRLAALKILNNIDLLEGTNLSITTKKRLREAATGFVPTGSISCVLFESRGDANDWIERRHGKGLEGEGRIPWGTLESDRFQKDRTVLDVIEFVERNSQFDEADWQRIKRSVEKSPTTLRRFLVSKAGRQSLGFIENDGEGRPAFRKDPVYIIKVLSQLFSDIDAGDVNSRTYNKASEISDYFSSLPSDTGIAGKEEAAVYSFASTDLKDGVKRPRLIEKTATATPIKTKRVTPPRITLAPARHTFAEPENEKGKQLLREASKLKLRETPLGCAFLFRAWLEFSVETEMRKSRLSKTGKDGEALDLQGRFNVVCRHFASDPARLPNADDLKPIKSILTVKSGSVSFAALNGYIHNHFQKPSADDLRNAWDHAIPLFTAIYGPHT